MCAHSLGPLVLMVYRMVFDMGKWLQLLSLVVLAFGLTLHTELRGAPLRCDDEGVAGLEQGLTPALWTLFKYAVGAADILELQVITLARMHSPACNPPHAISLISHAPSSPSSSCSASRTSGPLRW